MRVAVLGATGATGVRRFVDVGGAGVDVVTRADLAAFLADLAARPDDVQQAPLVAAR